MASDLTWAEFTADHDYRPAGQVWTVAYLAGMRCRVKGDCLAEAIELGRAKRIPAPDQAARIALKSDPFWREAPDGSDLGG